MEWNEVLDRYGFATMALVVLAGGVAASIVALWKAGKRIAAWCGKEIVLPLRDKYLAFLDDTAGSQRRQAGAVEQLVNGQIEHTKHMRWEEEKLEGMDNKLNNLANDSNKG